MVFIHGGAFLFGSGDSHNWHSIEKIVANSPVPVIAVTFNYRIGALGFLVHAFASQDLLLLRLVENLKEIMV